MKRSVPLESASAFIDAKINELGDWRGKMLAKVRRIIHAADPEIVEEWKWIGTPVFSHGGIVCTGETYKNVVKMTFAKGAALEDPSGLFNSSLDGNVRRAIDIREGDKVDEAALKDLIRAAVALNLKPKPKPRKRAASGPARFIARSLSLARSRSKLNGFKPAENLLGTTWPGISGDSSSNVRSPVALQRRLSNIYNSPKRVSR